MELCEELYIGESVKDLGTIVYALRRNIPLKNIVCICKGNNSKFLLEFMKTKELYRKRNENLLVVGIANSKQEAQELIAYMVQEKVAKHAGG